MFSHAFLAIALDAQHIAGNFSPDTAASSLAAFATAAVAILAFRLAPPLRPIAKKARVKPRDQARAGRSDTGEES